MKRESRVRLEVDLKKLSGNFTEVRRRVAPVGVMAVLKANAYGLGVLPVAEVVRAAGASCFGVAEINEAIELVPLGLPVQILGNLLPAEIEPAVEYGVVCPVNDLGMAKKISAEAVRQGKRVQGAIAIDSGMDIQKIVENKSWKSCSTPGSVSTYDIKPEYAAFLRKFAKMDRKLKVVVDYANAMGLYEIGGITDLFDIIPMYDVLDGTFPNHEANPLHLATLDAIRAKVVEVGADFGAAFDGDADRCGFIDNKGEIIPMDLFTALIAQDILSDGPATILYDLRSSRAVPECIRENGGKAIQSRVGHAFIKAQMRENDAVFAGELSGHYYFKENFTAECQGLAMIKLANLICKKNKPVDELVAPLRKYFSSGEINSTVADVKPILDAIRKKYADGNMYELDGISSEYPTWWFNVRSSNTEPLLRLIVEADTRALMEEKRDELLKLIRG